MSWLHGVAFRVASCQKRTSARRRKFERTAAERAVVSVADEHRDDVSLLLHQELDRLPEKYRAPMILCYFESLSHEQAAQQLQWPVGTVRSRLARGREQLRGRLVRRGFAPSCVLLERALCGEPAGAPIPPALATETAHAAFHYLSGRYVATSVTSTSVALLVEGAMNTMFLTKLKLALLTCGLIAASAVVVAQQVRTSVPEARIRAAGVDEPGNRSARAATPDDDDAAVAKELERLDLDLLAEDMRHARTQVTVAFRKKLQAEQKNSRLAGEAQKAYEAARAKYLTKARELRTAQRRLGDGDVAQASGAPRTKGESTPGDNSVARDLNENNRGSNPAGAAIGSIDMDAVFKRYEKVKSSSKEYNAALLARKSELMKIMDEAQQEAQLLSKETPGSDEYMRRQSRVTELKARHEAGREQAEQEFAQRQARTTADRLGEIRAVVTALAKAKGLNYVVKVSTGPRDDSAPIDVSAAFNHSVVYADPRSDLTEEVIRDLNGNIPLTGSKCAIK